MQSKFGLFDTAYDGFSGLTRRTRLSLVLWAEIPVVISFLLNLPWRSTYNRARIFEGHEATRPIP